MLVKMTTAIYPNRIKDKKKVEEELGLKESGDETTEFYTTKFTKLFIGYDRIVYGDAKAYVEFDPRHLVGKIVNKFPTKVPEGSYYEWKTVLDYSGIKIYWQLRDVKNLKNPPKGGYRGNRKEGYADYLPEKYYVDPYELYFKENLNPPLTNPEP